MQTEHDEDRSLANIETCRRINRRAGALYVAKGVRPDDVAIAAAFSAHDLAMHDGRDPHGAIEWLRTTLDVMERDLLARAAETVQ